MHPQLPQLNTVQEQPTGHAQQLAQAIQPQPHAHQTAFVQTMSSHGGAQVPHAAQATAQSYHQSIHTEQPDAGQSMGHMQSLQANATDSIPTTHMSQQQPKRRPSYINITRRKHNVIHQIGTGRSASTDVGLGATTAAGLAKISLSEGALAASFRLRALRRRLDRIIAAVKPVLATSSVVTKLPLHGSQSTSVMAERCKNSYGLPPAIATDRSTPPVLQPPSTSTSVPTTMSSNVTSATTGPSPDEHLASSTRADAKPCDVSVAAMTLNDLLASDAVDDDEVAGRRDHHMNVDGETVDTRDALQSLLSLSGDDAYGPTAAVYDTTACNNNTVTEMPSSIDLDTVLARNKVLAARIKVLELMVDERDKTIGRLSAAVTSIREKAKLNATTYQNQMAVQTTQLRRMSQMLRSTPIATQLQQQQPQEQQQRPQMTKQLPNPIRLPQPNMYPSQHMGQYQMQQPASVSRASSGQRSSLPYIFDNQESGHRRSISSSAGDSHDHRVIRLQPMSGNANSIPSDIQLPSFSAMSDRSNQ